MIGYFILHPKSIGVTEDQMFEFSVPMSLAKTPAGAWAKHTRGDLSKVQYWFDKGYRLRRCNIELLDD